VTEDDTMRQILANCRTIAVVGLSPKAHRASHGVASYMQAHGWRIVPVNPLATEVLGEPAYASLTAAAKHEAIDLVNVFRHSEEVPALVQEAVAIGAKTIWLQLGIEHDEALNVARQAGLLVIQNKCLKVEHARLG
jgi:uncharacterized protein